jgi:hypothetical protein
MPNAVSWFFDLYAQDREPPQPTAQADGGGGGGGDDDLAPWRQVVVYLASVVGILGGPYALSAAAGKYPTLLEMFGSPMRLFWAVVFGFVLTAFLFKIILSARNPLVVQIGAAIVAGFSSEKIVPKAIEALTSVVSSAGAT